MIDQLKKQINFHQSSWNRLRMVDPEQAAFHRGAVMAFSKSIEIFGRHVTEPSVQADAAVDSGLKKLKSDMPKTGAKWMFG